MIFAHTAGTSIRAVEPLFVGVGGVRLFFAISGFLITTLLLRERDATGKISLQKFVMRRTLRIFPLYYSILLVYVVLTFLTERHHEAGSQFFRNLPYFLTYTSNWFVSTQPARGADRVLFVFAWSLATEEQFYLVWPTVEKLAGATRATITIVCAIVVLIAFHLGALNSVFPSTGMAGVVIGSVSLSICMGVLIAHALHSPAGFRLLSRIWTPFNSLIGLIALGLLIVYSQSEILKSVASAFVVLSCVQCERHLLANMFRWRPLVLIGAVSYGMYLMHLLCNHAVKIVVRAIAHFQRRRGPVD